MPVGKAGRIRRHVCGDVQAPDAYPDPQSARGTHCADHLWLTTLIAFVGLSRYFVEQFFVGLSLDREAAKFDHLRHESHLQEILRLKSS